MERLSSRIGYYFRWMRSDRHSPSCKDCDHATVISDEHCQKCKDSTESIKRIFGILESILLWENSVNSISVVIVFNILFWGIVVLEIRGFAAASSAALVIVIGYSTVENQAQKEKGPISKVSQTKAEQIDKIVAKAKSTWKNLKQLRKDQPGVFCTAVCTLSLGIWLIGRTINGVLLAYTICMSILIGPALILQVPSRALSNKEWDSEIEEFLPVVTEDNLEVLKLAGESGDHSPTPPPVVSEMKNDPFDLVGLKMPSHEEGSTDGLELSELELSAGETDIDGIKFQSGHFEKGSSSGEEEVELDLKSQSFLSHSREDSDSEFEIIDSHEIVHFKDV
ncbi:reticulophagy regulator 2-like [Belonocnema kinseyi]|uniref:reticulophagy regulator 2-like n=1 Tax=Belonocnema kinseyi TaxID=2817044 RepID=UPI00143D2AEC|nr:reticulophagy regulator 2-like [Belonocnema kinseyi]